MLGVVLRQRRPGWAGRWERPLEGVANRLFALILAIAILGEWTTLVDNLDSLGPVQLSLNLGMLAIESGFQNGTVGIAVGALLASAELAGSRLSAYSLPSAVCGVLMMVTTLPYLAWRRSLHPLAAAIQTP